MTASQGPKRKGKEEISDENFFHLDKEEIEGKTKKNRAYKILNKLNTINNNTHTIA